jgi:hypothetical protein
LPIDIEKHLHQRIILLQEAVFDLKGITFAGLLFKYARTQGTESAEKGNGG